MTTTDDPHLTSSLMEDVDQAHAELADATEREWRLQEELAQVRAELTYAQDSLAYMHAYRGAQHD